MGGVAYIQLIQTPLTGIYRSQILGSGVVEFDFWRTYALEYQSANYDDIAKYHEYHQENGNFTQRLIRKDAAEEEKERKLG